MTGICNSFYIDSIVNISLLAVRVYFLGGPANFGEIFCDIVHAVEGVDATRQRARQDE